jgi:hypothetical protein
VAALAVLGAAAVLALVTVAELAASGAVLRSSAAAGTVELTVDVIGAEPATSVPVTSLLIVLIGLCMLAGVPGGGGAMPVPVRSIVGTGVASTVELTGVGPAITVGATSGVMAEIAAGERSVPLTAGRFDDEATGVAAEAELVVVTVTLLADRPEIAAGSLGLPTTFAG